MTTKEHVRECLEKYLKEESVTIEESAQVKETRRAGIGFLVDSGATDKCELIDMNCKGVAKSISECIDECINDTKKISDLIITVQKDSGVDYEYYNVTFVH